MARANNRLEPPRFVECQVHMTVTGMERMLNGELLEDIVHSLQQMEHKEKLEIVLENA